MPPHFPTSPLPHCLFLLLALATPGCGGSGPPKGPKVDTELAQQNAAARLAFERGSSAQAVTLYERALNRARAMDDAAEIANVGYNLAAALVAAGEYDRAATVLRQAEFDTRRAGGNLADVLLLEANVARLRGDTATATGMAERVLSSPESKPTPGHRIQAHVLRGELALEARDDISARAELDRAERLLEATATPGLRAGVAGLRGRLRLAAGDHAGAAARFDEQADLLRRAARYRDMARALADAGDAFREAGMSHPAAERFFRAARASAAQGNPEQALKHLASASAMARQGFDPEMSWHIDALREELNPSTRPATRTTQ